VNNPRHRRVWWQKLKDYQEEVQLPDEEKFSPDDEVLAVNVVAVDSNIPLLYASTPQNKCGHIPTSIDDDESKEF